MHRSLSCSTTPSSVREKQSTGHTAMQGASEQCMQATEIDFSAPDRKSVVGGKSGDRGGRRIIKKKRACRRPRATSWGQIGRASGKGRGENSGGGGTVKKKRST